MASDFYRSWEPLLPPGAAAKGPLLLLSPHPDDEVIGAAGLIVGHGDEAQPVRVVVMTDGRLGDAGGEHDEAYVAVRHEECRRGLGVLGVDDVVFLDFPDGSLRRELEDGDSPAIVEKLAAMLRERPVATLAVPSPFELHPDHRATCLAGLRAAARVGLAGEVLCYEVGSFMPGNLLLDVTGVFERKIEALRCHASQLQQIDIVTKVTGLNVARSANVPDPAITHCEAYLRITPEQIGAFLEASERLLLLTDSMAPPVPWE